ncbi:hypothetical protein QYE76_041830 [Lolium multiflorum]|uniref:Reverse transcriptase domain-containing protein n=1 Tax=Lolium multiflorum TaxID=4521 RepID=A0AAD8TFM0_LOLMU|nr:hypothetical protein QYE76_041830 [Lolium multiflorum]
MRPLGSLACRTHQNSRERSRRLDKRPPHLRHAGPTKTLEKGPSRLDRGPCFYATSHAGRLSERAVPRRWVVSAPDMWARVLQARTMPFGLKNAGAAYQWMMQKCLAMQIGKNVQVYINDVVITTKQGSSLIDDLKETFDNLDKFRLKLNPTKCSFGVPAGELLGYLVSARGIEANPEKIKAIVTMRKPTKLKEIQQLTERVAALSRFIARLSNDEADVLANIRSQCLPTPPGVFWEEISERSTKEKKTPKQPKKKRRNPRKTRGLRQFQKQICRKMRRNQRKL